MKRTKTIQLKDLLRQQRAEDSTLDKKMAELTLLNSWNKIAGSTIASYTQKLSVKNDVLFLKLTSPAVKNEIRLMNDHIIASINHAVGGELIKRIVFL